MPSSPPPWKGGVGGGSASTWSNGHGLNRPTHPQPLPSREGSKFGADRPSRNPVTRARRAPSCRARSGIHRAACSRPVEYAGRWALASAGVTEEGWLGGWVTQRRAPSAERRAPSAERRTRPDIRSADYEVWTASTKHPPRRKPGPSWGTVMTTPALRYGHLANSAPAFAGVGGAASA